MHLSVHCSWAWKRNWAQISFPSIIRKSAKTFCLTKQEYTKIVSIMFYTLRQTPKFYHECFVLAFHTKLDTTIPNLKLPNVWVTCPLYPKMHPLFLSFFDFLEIWKWNWSFCHRFTLSCSTSLSFIFNCNCFTDRDDARSELLTKLQLLFGPFVKQIAFQALLFSSCNTFFIDLMQESWWGKISQICLYV